MSFDRLGCVCEERVLTLPADPANGLGLSRSSSTSSLRGLLDSTFPQGLEGRTNGHINGHTRHGSGSRLPDLKLGISEHRMNGTVEHRMEDGTPSAFAQGLPPLGSPSTAGSPSLAPRVGNLSLRDEEMNGRRPGSAMDLDS